MTDQEFANFFAIAQSIPGPNMILMMSFVGWKVWGFPGAAASAFATFGPPCAMYFAAYQRGIVPQCAMATDRSSRPGPGNHGARIASGTVMARAADAGWRAAAVTIAATAITLGTRLNPLWLLLAGGALGGLGLCEGREEIRPRADRPATSISFASLFAIAPAKDLEILDDQHKSISPADQGSADNNSADHRAGGCDRNIPDWGRVMIASSLMVSSVDTAWSRASGMERPELLVPSPEMRMRPQLHFELANCAIAKSMPELTRFAPRKNAVQNGSLWPPTSSSSRITVQSTTTCCSSSPNHSIKQMPIDPPINGFKTRGSLNAAA